MNKLSKDSWMFGMYSLIKGKTNQFSKTVFLKQAKASMNIIVLYDFIRKKESKLLGRV